ncbi:DUF2141 domain-containing protein [Aerophototrophica crusticola]|uniref:DUF2141 domain-containing protein n=1 Tax=Aerophototrophica crusticola TaxID=1709002 RepID=A0A858R8U1_9PROT|nr:DUF2141 domain-containing protein [Rhodospirillaceae bacterium B3]
MPARLAAVLSVLALAVPGAAAADLTVTTPGISGAEGTVRVMLFDNDKDYRDLDRPRLTLRVPALDGVPEYRIGGLAPGSYAVAAHHDRDNDGDVEYTVADGIGDPLAVGGGRPLLKRPPIPAFADVAVPLAGKGPAAVALALGPGAKLERRPQGPTLRLRNLPTGEGVLRLRLFADGKGWARAAESGRDATVFLNRTGPASAELTLTLPPLPEGRYAVLAFFEPIPDGRLGEGEPRAVSGEAPAGGALPTFEAAAVPLLPGTETALTLR